MTITEARAICVAARDAGQKVFGDRVAEEEAQYEPFRKILTGISSASTNDRLKKLQTLRRRRQGLKTPEAYRDYLSGALPVSIAKASCRCGLWTAGTSKACQRPVQSKPERAPAMRRLPRRFVSRFQFLCMVAVLTVIS